MRSRRLARALCALTPFLVLLSLQSDTVRAISTTVVISEFRVRGPNGAADEFVELYNASSAAVSVGGWKIGGSNNSAGVSTRVTLPAGASIGPGCFYLITNSSASGGPYSGAVPGNATFTVGITDDGGIALMNAANAIVDQVGMSSGSAYKEGTPLASLGSTNANRGYERKPGGAAGNGTDTDNNSADFQQVAASNPQNAASPCIPIAPGDAAPVVATTAPANLATAVAVDATVTINFSESVVTAAGAFTFECADAPQPFVQSASPNTSIVLFPTSPLPYNALCRVEVLAAQVTDTDATDPPDQMPANFSFSFTTQEPPPEPSTAVVVIGQIYGGGGNNGATYQNDFVELYNRGTVTVDLAGWSIQYASSTGNNWDNRQPLGGPIAPGEHLLIALASGGDDGIPLPPPNISGAINMSATSGKVALVDNYDLLTGTCPVADPHVVDFVGYGGAANCREGATNAPAGSNTAAILRLGDGGTDTNRNGSDFVSAPPAPQRTAPIVELGPAVLATDPRFNAGTAPRDATIAVTFTEPVDVSAAWFDLTCAVSGRHTDATFAASGNTRFITPNVNFIAGERCTAAIFKDQVHDTDSDDASAATDTLAADYIWSFSIATGDAPLYPPDVHLTMGNPTDASASPAEPDNFLMEKPEFALSYNRSLGRPNWVSWHLSDEWVGSLVREDTFRPDPAIPADWYRVQSFDFFSTGFDRGHMVPNADRDKETARPINQATFLMSNMVAQAPGNNQGPWASLENELRTLLPANELYIVAGGQGSGGIGSNGGTTYTVADGHVTVPAYTWKVALVLPKGDGDDVSRASCSARTIAVIMPNIDSIRNNPWQDFLTTVDAVESLTGYDFFAALPEPVQRCVEAGVNGVNPLVPVFDELSSPTIEAGTAAASVSGRLLAGGTVPTGSVTVAVGSITVNAPLGPDGRFTAVLPTSGLAAAAAPYPISFSYPGAPGFTFANAASTLTVIDTTAPAIDAVKTTPDALGAPNHKMIDVSVGYTATDFSGAPTCRVTVSSNEPVNGLGDGNTSIDWQVIDAHHVQLRAERSGKGSGRIYTVTVSCVDAAGNASVATGTVNVSK